MSLRRRMALLSGVTTALAVVLTVVLGYLIVQGQITGQIDDDLSRGLEVIARLPEDGEVPKRLERIAERAEITPAQLRGDRIVQVTDSSGDRRRLTESGPELPGATALGGNPENPRLESVVIEGEEYRLATAVLEDGTTVQVARPLAESNRVLADLRLLLAVLAASGIALAVVAGRYIGRVATGPITRLGDAVARISASADLSRRVEVERGDETGALAKRFNQLLEGIEAVQAELTDALASQQRLISDASHELRTPVAALRTNLAVLREETSLSGEQREALLGDLEAEAEELGLLVADVVALARDEAAASTLEVQEIRLDGVVGECLRKFSRRYPDLELESTLEETTVVADPARVARAVTNLLDNAAKHGEGPVEVAVTAGSVTVRDHGRGLDPSERDEVFRRFSRGVHGRESPGSGLGLAIVRQTATLHGGEVEVLDHPDEGAIFVFSLPVLEAGA